MADRTTTRGSPDIPTPGPPPPGHNWDWQDGQWVAVPQAHAASWLPYYYAALAAMGIGGAYGLAGAGATGAGAGGGLVSGTGAGGSLGGVGGMGGYGYGTGGSLLASVLGGGGGGAGGGGGINLTNLLTSGGLNLVDSYLQSRAISQQNQMQQQQIRDRIDQALQQLSPEQIDALSKTFLPQIYQQQSAQNQTQIQALNQSAAAKGLLGSPYTLTAEAGLRAQQANNASLQAFQQAFGLASQRASAITGAPYANLQSPLGPYGNLFGNTGNQYLTAQYIDQLRRMGQPPQPTGASNPASINTGGSVPYRLPSNPSGQFGGGYI